jgi:hypothetical protein
VEQSGDFNKPPLKEEEEEKEREREEKANHPGDLLKTRHNQKKGSSPFISKPTSPCLIKRVCLMRKALSIRECICLINSSFIISKEEASAKGTPPKVPCFETHCYMSVHESSSVLHIQQ